MTTAEAMTARAVTSLAEMLEHHHDDPHASAQRFIRRLQESGWRPLPELLDRPGPAPRANAETARKWIREIRAERGWPEPGDGAA